MLNSDWHTIHTEPKTSTAIIETVVLTFLGVGLGYLFMPDAPYFASQGFSWLMLGPSLSGLRYGFTYSLNSLILLVLLAYIGHYYQYPWAQGSPFGLGLSLVFVAVIAGEFRNYWHRRIKRLNAVAVYLDERVNELSHAFNVLKHSHDRLEQMIASRISLRDSILNVRRQILLSHTIKEDLNGLGLLILRSLADLGSLQGASLYAAQNEGKSISEQAVAYIGSPIPLNPQNPLLLTASSTHKSVSLKLNLISQKERELLLVIPLVDVNDKLFGVIAVNKMPFRAFREDNIQLLSILGGYIGDLLGAKLKPKEYIADENLLYFYIQSMRCMQDVLNFNLAASLLAIEFKNSVYLERLLALISFRQRGLDQQLIVTNQSGNTVILLILPLTDHRGIEGYFLRLKTNFKTEFGIVDFEELGIHYHTQVLTADKTLEQSMQEIADKMKINNIFSIKP